MTASWLGSGLGLGLGSGSGLGLGSGLGSGLGLRLGLGAAAACQALGVGGEQLSQLRRARALRRHVRARGGERADEDLHLGERVVEALDLLPHQRGGVAVAAARAPDVLLHLG
eukprot:scaffold14709_cov69-Phaeocystis_antarctica.AAC.2